MNQTAATPNPAQETAALAVVRTLVNHKLDTIYCLPGIQNDAIFNAFHDVGNAIRTVHTRHEQGAAYMAIGAAMATGKPSGFCVVPGPGFLNTTSALSTAIASSARVLCLAGQIPRADEGRGFGIVHEIPDQLAILKQLTKWSTRVGDPKEAAVKTAIALRHVASGRPLPVGIEIPTDVLASKGSLRAYEPFELEPEPVVDLGRLEEAASLLAKAERPLVVVGAGALDASEEVRSLAEYIQAPVVAHRMGRGVMDSRNPLSQDMPGGHRLWRDCDVVLALGTRLIPQRQNWGTDDRLKVIHVDIDPEQLSHGGELDVAIIGSVKLVAAQLDAEIRRKMRPAASRSAEMVELKAAVASDMAYLAPQLAFLDAIRDVLPENGIYVDEITQLGYVARLSFPTYRPRTYLSPGYQGTLGWGFATALGVKDACPDVPVVSINGDGGFLFAQPEMATAVHHKIPLVTVVFNDNAYGNVQRMQKELYGNRVIASDLSNPDFMKLSDSFGIAAERTDSPEGLRKALERRLAERTPSLIEVTCGAMPNPRKMLSLPRVRGLAAGG